MNQARHKNDAHKLMQFITVSKEGSYFVVLCPREFAHLFIKFAEERLSPADHFLAMGETQDDAILQTTAGEADLEEITTKFVQSLSEERVEAFLEKHPQLGSRLPNPTLVDCA